MEAGEHHHAGVRADRHDSRQGLESVAGGHRGVQEEQVRLVTDRQGDRLVPVATLADDVEESGALESAADEAAQLG